MANRFYRKGKKHFGLGDVSWKNAGGSTVRCFLVDLNVYTPDTDVDEFLSAIPAAARMGGSGTGYNQGALMNLIDCADGGVLDAQDTTLLAVTGDEGQPIVIYVEGTSDADSIMLLLLETGAGLPVTPNGGDVECQWPNDADRIARL